jgi:hypothetical protein
MHMTKLSREIETLIAIQGELALLRDDMAEIKETLTSMESTLNAIEKAAKGPPSD